MLYMIEVYSFDDLDEDEAFVIGNLSAESVAVFKATFDAFGHDYSIFELD